jgi:hypothetical protein
LFRFELKRCLAIFVLSILLIVLASSTAFAKPSTHDAHPTKTAITNTCKTDGPQSLATISTRHTEVEGTAVASFSYIPESHLSQA